MTVTDVLAEMAAGLPEWHARAACRGEDPALFFPEPGQPVAAAKAICGRCEVRAECLDYAIDGFLDAGIFGGVAPRERVRMARARGRPPQPQFLYAMADSPAPE